MTAESVPAGPLGSDGPGWRPAAETAQLPEPGVGSARIEPIGEAAARAPLATTPQGPGPIPETNPNVPAAIEPRPAPGVLPAESATDRISEQLGPGAARSEARARATQILATAALQPTDEDTRGQRPSPGSHQVAGPELPLPATAMPKQEQAAGTTGTVGDAARAPATAAVPDAGADVPLQPGVAARPAAGIEGASDAGRHRASPPRSSPADPADVVPAGPRGASPGPDQGGKGDPAAAPSPAGLPDGSTGTGHAVRKGVPGPDNAPLAAASPPEEGEPTRTVVTAGPAPGATRTVQGQEAPRHPPAAGPALAGQPEHPPPSSVRANGPAEPAGPPAAREAAAYVPVPATDGSADRTAPANTPMGAGEGPGPVPGRGFDAPPAISARWAGPAREDSQVAAGAAAGHATSPGARPGDGPPIALSPSPGAGQAGAPMPGQTSAESGVKSARVDASGQGTVPAARSATAASVASPPPAVPPAVAPAVPVAVPTVPAPSPPAEHGGRRDTPAMLVTTASGLAAAGSANAAPAPTGPTNRPAVAVTGAAVTAETRDPQDMGPEIRSDAPGRVGESEPQRPAAVSRTTIEAPTSLPRQALQQVAEALRALPDRPVEISLSPEELGRVRLTVATTDGGANVTILADRGETLDLIRRQIDSLASELRDAGLTNLAFHFGQSGDEPRREMQGPEPTLTAEADAPVAIALGPADGLDLRL